MTDWDLAAHAKLASVLGPAKAEQLTAKVLAAMGRDSLGSANELYDFAQELIAEGGFVGAVGGLLAVHATIHGASAKERRASSGLVDAKG